MTQPWPRVELGEALSISTERLEPREHANVLFNYIGLEHIEGHTGRILPHEPTYGGEIASTKNVFRSGEILYGKLRPYLNKVHVAAGDGICSTDIYVLHCGERKALPSYAAFFLRSPVVLDRVTNLMQGANLPRLSASALLGISIPLPPLPEQERIVRLLDAAEELRRLRAQADRRTADLIPALFHDRFGDPASSQYPSLNLSDAAEVVSGVTKGRNFNGRQTVVAPYIRVANVQAGFLDLSEIKTIEALPEEVQFLALQRGDVLLTEGGDFDKLGRGALWDADIPECIHQNHVFRVRVDEAKLLPVYFSNYLLTPFAKAYFLQCAKKTTNLASINMTQLRALPVPIPPLDFQRQFAARVLEIRQLEARQAECRHRLDDLFQSLLHRAYQGEL